MSICRDKLPARPTRHRTLVSLAMATVLSMMVAPTQAERVVNEYDLKLVYLYNFTKFVTWPAHSFERSQGDFNICVYGPRPTQTTIDQLTAKKTAGRSMKFTELSEQDAPNGCHILFFRATNGETVQKILDRLDQQPVLTVGESKGFASSAGGVIEFSLTESNRLDLIINLKTARARGMDISAKLLEVATEVHHTGGS